MCAGGGALSAAATRARSLSLAGSRHTNRDPADSHCPRRLRTLPLPTCLAYPRYADDADPGAAARAQQPAAALGGGGDGGGYDDDDDPPAELYGAICPWLLPRLAVLPSPVRAWRQAVPGCLSAPAGVVAPVFCNVLGVEALLAWERVVQQRQLVAAAAATTVTATATAASTPRGLRSSPEVSSHHALTRPPTAAAYGDGWPPTPRAPQPSVSAAGAAAANGGGGAVVQHALEQLRRLATAAAVRHGGYVVAVSADGGHWVLVFGSASAAVGWGLDMLDAMLVSDWPEGFLEHELTEEVWEGTYGMRFVYDAHVPPAVVRSDEPLQAYSLALSVTHGIRYSEAPFAVHHPSSPRKADAASLHSPSLPTGLPIAAGVLVKRGLRLRIGADLGCAMLRPVPRTGRLDYVGRPMNRAARIAAKAKAASVGRMHPA
jgi:class 3 adenylate cyclase